MSKNIVIYSDGTGNSSGIYLDENRSNIYKLYRATRCGPESRINPSEQLAFYDPGVGTSSLKQGLFSNAYQWLINLVGKATGLGLTANVVDCYAAIIRLWEPGDKIFLFGFSRGAYTIRLLGGVLAKCGVPTTMSNGVPVRRDVKTSKAIARRAVTKVYQHVSSIPVEQASPREKELLKQRSALAAEFREQYGSDTDGKPNVAPHFIGVFDTVSSLGNLGVVALLVLLGFGALAGVSGLISLITPDIGWLFWFYLLGIFSTFMLLSWFLIAHLKVPGRLVAKDGTQYSWWQTLTFGRFLMKFDDYELSTSVVCARHAISIDERRETFQNVPWVNTGTEKAAEPDTPEWFEQVWFAGVHSDIGGSYSENDARLSDITLKWMLRAADLAGLKYDARLLNLFPDPNGPQHDELKSSIFGLFGAMDRKIGNNAELHKTVIKRFKAGPVLHFDRVRDYRPKSLESHPAVKDLY